MESDEDCRTEHVVTGTANTVLVALDQSEEACVAFQYYLDHVHQHDYRIVLLQMADTPSQRIDAVMGDESHEMTEDTHSRARLIETRYADKLKDQKVCGRVRTVPIEDAAEAIVEEARTENVAMVTIGTQGVVSMGTGFGPLPDYIIRHAPCPVVILDSTSRESTM